MQKLTIMSYNTKNHYWRKNYDGKRSKLVSWFLGEKDEPKILANLVKNNDVDVLATQEITPKYSENLLSRLNNFSNNNTWNKVGKFRYNKKNCFTAHYNEGCHIFSKYKPNNNYTKWYSKTPNFSSKDKKFVFPRIYTVAEYFESSLVIINTHLSAENINLVKKQLQMLLEIIKKMSPKQRKIIVGDFNITKDNEIMKNFITELNKIGIKCLDLKENTFNFGIFSKTLDYIFYSDTIEIDESKVIKLNKQDHNPILVKLHFDYRKH